MGGLPSFFQLEESSIKLYKWVYETKSSKSKANIYGRDAKELPEAVTQNNLIPRTEVSNTPF